MFACVCPQAVEQMGIPLTQQASNESRLSMSESVSEFFDAQEVLLSASSSENEVERGEMAVEFLKNYVMNNEEVDRGRKFWTVFSHHLSD